MHNERRLQQMIQFLANLNIEAWICVLEDDILLSFEQRFGIQVFTGTGLSQRVDISPLGGTRATWRRVPFLA